jgi:hypothetical protein
VGCRGGQPRGGNVDYATNVMIAINEKVRGSNNNTTQARAARRLGTTQPMTCCTGNRQVLAQHAANLGNTRGAKDQDRCWVGKYARPGAPDRTSRRLRVAPRIGTKAKEKANGRVQNLHRLPTNSLNCLRSRSIPSSGRWRNGGLSGQPTPMSSSVRQIVGRPTSQLYPGRPDIKRPCERAGEPSNSSRFGDRPRFGAAGPLEQTPG